MPSGEALVPLTDPAELEVARSCYRHVFSIQVMEYAKPFRLFWPQLEHRSVALANRRGLSHEQIERLGEAMRAIGDDGFYVTETESPRPEHRATWRVTLERLEDYEDDLALRMWGENALYGNGWGIWVTQDSGLLIASSHAAFTVADDPVAFVKHQRWLLPPEITDGWDVEAMEEMHWSDESRRLLVEGGWYTASE